MATVIIYLGIAAIKIYYYKTNKKFVHQPFIMHYITTKYKLMFSNHLPFTGDNKNLTDTQTYNHSTGTIGD